MKFEVYYWLKVVIFLFLFLLMVAIQSVVFQWSIISWLGIDILLLCILYFAIRKNTLEGMILSLILSYFAELNSPASNGLIFSCYMVTYILTTVAKDFILLQKSKTFFTLVLFGCFTWKLSFLVITTLIGNIAIPLQKIILSFPFYLAVQFLLTKPLIHILERIDSLSEKPNSDRYIPL